MIEAILNGEDDISVVIHENEYLYGFCEDVHRPNKKDIKKFENKNIEQHLYNDAKSSESEFTM